MTDDGRRLVAFCVALLGMSVMGAVIIAADEPLFRKQPCDMGGGSCGGGTQEPEEPEPDVPGCASITASQRCYNNGNHCLDDLEMYWCCRLDTGPCMTLIDGVAHGLQVWSASPPLLPGDFVFSIEDTDILEAETEVDIVTYLRMMPRVRVLRIAVDHLGNRYTTSVVVDAPKSFLWRRATWEPGVGVVAVDE